MKAGVSTASLYPLHAEDAFRELARLGVTTAELFANSTSEAREPVTGIIRDTMQEYGMEVVSFHPFSSPMESVYLFSEYDRRIEEMLTMYREFFGTMNRLGAKIFVLHGAILSSGCTPEHYVKQFRLLAEAAEEYGVQFYYQDFRPMFRDGQARARELGFYMQKYCGCVFSEQERYQKPSRIIP